MIIKFRIISTEIDGFVRDIEISSDMSFYDLHLAIQAACDYDEGIMAAFYTSGKEWNRGQEIVLQIMDEEEQKNALLMKNISISEYIKSKGDRLLYLYDFFSVRYLFIEVVNLREKTQSDEYIEYPVCTLSEGKPPQQILVDDITDICYEDDVREEFDDFEDMGFDNIDDYNL